MRTSNANGITASDIPEYLDGDSATVELPNGWTAEVRVETDGFNDAPWEQEDGHGPVSRDWRALDSKRPGERVLCQDRGRARFYDFAEAVRIARRDQWGCVHGEGFHVTCVERITVAPLAIPGAVAACAAERDFNRLRAWCAGEWEYVSISVTVRDAAGDTVERDSLGGVESDGDYWRECAAEMIEGIISGVLTPNHAAPGGGK